MHSKIPGFLKFLSLPIAATLIFHSTGFAAFDWNGVRIEPYADLSESYDDNITFRKNDPIDDFITSLALGLGAKYETGLTRLDITGILRYDFFADHDEFNNLSGDVTADWRQELSKYDRLRLKDNYYHSDEARNFTDAFNKAAGRFSYQRNRFSADYEHDFNSQWGAVARYENDVTVYSADGFNDSMMNSVGGDVVYNVDSSTKLLAGYDFKIREFDHGGNATVHGVSGGLRRYFTKQVYFDGRAGVDFIDAYDGRNLTEPNVSAKLTDDLNETTRVDVAFELEHSLNAYTEDIFDHWQVSSSFKKEWTRRLDTLFSVFYGDGDYVSTDRHDEFFGANVALNYELVKDWRAMIKYNFTNVDSSLDSEEYQRNVVLLGIARHF